MFQESLVQPGFAQAGSVLLQWPLALAAGQSCSRNLALPDGPKVVKVSVRQPRPGEQRLWFSRYRQSITVKAEVGLDGTRDRPGVWFTATGGQAKDRSGKRDVQESNSIFQLPCVCRQCMRVYFPARPDALNEHLRYFRHYPEPIYPARRVLYVSAIAQDALLTRLDVEVS